MAATFHASGHGEQTTGSASFSITCTISAGDSVVVFASWDIASTTTPTVTTTGGTGSDSFTLIYGPSSSSSTFKYGAWLLQSAGSGRTGATISWASSNPAFADGWCESFTGLTSPALDGNHYADGTGTAISSGNTATLTTSDQFAVSYAASGSSSVSAATSPWTDDGGAGTGSRGAHRILTATTAITSTFTEPASSFWISFVLTFKSGAVQTLVFGSHWYPGDFRTEPVSY